MHAEVSGAHGEVGESDLDVKRGSDHVGDKDECHPCGPGGDAEVYCLVAEPVPEENVTGDLKVAMPPGGTFSWGLRR